ncbi:hypothetical protein HS125_05670 [bacterium]|nr:hypothetical protein [bacterium]
MEGAIAGPALQQSLLALQERKLVLLCVQNGNTQQNAEAMKAVREFKADARFTQATQIIMVDPASQAEQKFLAQLNIGSDTRSPDRSPGAAQCGAGRLHRRDHQDVLVNTWSKRCPRAVADPAAVDRAAADRSSRTTVQSY